MKSILLLLALLLGVSMAHLTIKGKYTPLGKSSSKVHFLPLQDNKQLLLNEDKSHGGYQFGNPVRFPLKMEDGVWTTLSNGDMTWTITIKSEGALSMGVSMRDFFIPEGAELYVVGEKEIRGAYSSVNNHASGRFTTWPLEGSSITLEYYHPAGIKEMPRLNVFRVTHGYKPTGFGDSGTCNNNVRCDDGTWANEIRSVGMLLTAFGSRYCSGALVNNAAGARTQYFLTANHCSVGSGDSVLFNYQSPTCTPNADGTTSNVIGGLVPLVSNVYSDFDLVRIDEAIPASWNVYYSGLSASDTPATRVVGIHHPSGDVKKISYANKAVYADRWNAAEPGLWHWEISSWDDGTTEPGSSGSPLFDQNKRIVGQLHGGAAACSNKLYDSYGATWASWANGLKTYLDPNNSGNTLINGTNPAAF